MEDDQGEDQGRRAAGWGAVWLVPGAFGGWKRNGDRPRVNLVRAVDRQQETKKNLREEEADSSRLVLAAGC